eukprot:806239-Lingulodinium_polyedra.AAC.1
MVWRRTSLSLGLALLRAGPFFHSTWMRAAQGSACAGICNTMHSCGWPSSGTCTTGSGTIAPVL